MHLPQIGNSIRSTSEILENQVFCKCEFSLNVKRTVKPCDAAQTLVPSTLKMAALSTLPVPTRLNRVSVMSMMIIYTVVGTLCQHTLHNSNQSACSEYSASMGRKETAYLATTWQLL